MHKEIIVQPYNALVSVGVGSITLELKYLKRKYNIVEKADTAWAGLYNYQYSDKLERSIFYIIINSNNTAKKDYWNTIAHEITHLVQGILENRGIYFQRHQDNEAYAYTAGYITGELFEFFEKEYNKINK